MNVAAGPELAAAVTNAGGLGVIGGHGYTPRILRQQVCGILVSFSHRKASGRVNESLSLPGDAVIENPK